MGIINFTAPISGNFLVNIIIWLVSISSSIAVGIVLFTVILKLITLPFDYASRASMRKNTLKMEQMRPELEKLQKQYADNKDLYNQKMMALYKKNGYSMFGACLPTILTLVIFIVAINAFTTYSAYQNKMYFYNMSTAYNRVVYEGLESDGEYITHTNDATYKLVVKEKELYELASANGNDYTFSSNGVNITVKLTSEDEKNYISVKTEKGYVEYKHVYHIVDGKFTYAESSADYTALEIVDNSPANIYNNELKNAKGQTYAVAKAENAELTASAFLADIQSEMSAKAYKSEEKGFLWVRNIWVTDSPLKHPVESSWENFKTAHQYDGNNIGEDNYAKLIAHLEEEKTAPNGYFILVVLTAGLSLLQQLIMTKTQKASMELQTVDGQGAQTQKIMTWMMPIMMAVFAFMYTSAFSIYIVLSTIISMLTTFGINFIVDRKFKKEEEKVKKENETIRGRVYTPKKEEKEQKPVKKQKEEPKADFLSGTADNKKSHIRGRIK